MTTVAESPATKVALRQYLADRLRDQEPGVGLDDVVDAFWTLYASLRSKATADEWADDPGGGPAPAWYPAQELGTDEKAS